MPIKTLHYTLTICIFKLFNDVNITPPKSAAIFSNNMFAITFHDIRLSIGEYSYKTNQTRTAKMLFNKRFVFWIFIQMIIAVFNDVICAKFQEVWIFSFFFAEGMEQVLHPKWIDLHFFAQYFYTVVWLYCKYLFYDYIFKCKDIIYLSFLFEYQLYLKPMMKKKRKIIYKAWIWRYFVVIEFLLKQFSVSLSFLHRLRLTGFNLWLLFL